MFIHCILGFLSVQGLVLMHVWSPTSWRQLAYEQIPIYPNLAQLAQTIAALGALPPLVAWCEVERLKQWIALAGQGNAFLLQGGDCAESFEACYAEAVGGKLDILGEMGRIIQRGLRRRVVCVGRIAGQFAKPRSSSEETKQGVTLPSYRGDLIHAAEFTAQARTPNPERMLQGYHCAAETLSHIKAQLRAMPQEEFYTSHEALHLYYEEALVRKTPDGKWYNSSAHWLWIGMRTAKIGYAHLEFVRGIENPVGIKIGPEVTPNELIGMLECLNPRREMGRVVLITRMGAKAINRCLPPLIQAVVASQIPVTWSCDPMHGNTETTCTGLKTRHFNVIFSELEQAASIHRALGSHLGGIHLELTGEDVTECLGGSYNLRPGDLARDYQSTVDPRLNYGQSLEIAACFSALDW